MKSFKQFIGEAEFRLDTALAKLHKKFPGKEALNHSVEHMSDHLQKEHGWPKKEADAAASNHKSFQEMMHKYSGPEYVSRDSSD